MSTITEANKKATIMGKERNKNEKINFKVQN